MSLGVNVHVCMGSAELISFSLIDRVLRNSKKIAICENLIVVFYFFIFFIFIMLLSNMFYNV